MYIIFGIIQEVVKRFRFLQSKEVEHNSFGKVKACPLMDSSRVLFSVLSLSLSLKKAFSNLGLILWDSAQTRWHFLYKALPKS